MSAGHGSHGGRRRKHHDDHEEHPSEAWLIALADMMTLLMVTFLMMFAISSLDLKKFQTFKEAFAEGTGTTLPSLPGEGVPTDGEISKDPLAPKDGTPVPQASMWSANTGGKILDPKALNELKKRIDTELKKAGLGDKVEAKIDDRGLVLYVTSAVLFESGEADVTRQGTAMLDGLGEVLKGVGNPLIVEGHTDSRPVRSGPFRNNWALSAMRATAVADQLMDKAHISPKRISIAGYADTRPREDAPTEHAYALNRRVEIVVEAPKTAAGASTAPAAGDASPAPAAKAVASPTAVPSPKAAAKAGKRH
ncbi:MAG: OmpA/MotB domain protein [Frankiales bacterium]|nr:OmpA/MotB domain protein [Frankiales bacterium]